VSLLNCVRPLCSGNRAPETVMSMGGQITDGIRLYARIGHFHVTYLIVVCKRMIFVRYFLRVTVVKWLSDIVKELPLAVRTVSPHSNTSCSIKMEVGIEDALHIEFEYNKSRFCMLVLYQISLLDHCRR